MSVVLIPEIGKEYYYETRGHSIRHNVLVAQTPAWNIFKNGDHIARYSPLYETKEEVEGIAQLVHKMYVDTYVPEVVHIPNAFTK